MTEEKMSPREFWDKLMWEGGLYDGFEYGARSHWIIDKPKNKKFIELMQKYEEAFLIFNAVDRIVSRELAEMGFQDD